MNPPNSSQPQASSSLPDQVIEVVNPPFPANSNLPPNSGPYLNNLKGFMNPKSNRRYVAAILPLIVFVVGIIGAGIIVQNPKEIKKEQAASQKIPTAACTITTVPNTAGVKIGNNQILTADITLLEGEKVLSVKFAPADPKLLALSTQTDYSPPFETEILARTANKIDTFVNIQAYLEGNLSSGCTLAVPVSISKE